MYHIVLENIIVNAMGTLEGANEWCLIVGRDAHCTGVALAGCPILLATGSPVDEIFDSRHVRTWLSVEHNAPNPKAEGRNGKHSLSSVSITAGIECSS